MLGKGSGFLETISNSNKESHMINVCVNNVVNVMVVAMSVYILRIQNREYF